MVAYKYYDAPALNNEWERWSTKAFDTSSIRDRDCTDWFIHFSPHSLAFWKMAFQRSLSKHLTKSNIGLLNNRYWEDPVDAKRWPGEEPLMPSLPTNWTYAPHNLLRWKDTWIDGNHHSFCWLRMRFIPWPPISQASLFTWPEVKGLSLSSGLWKWS